MNQPLTLSTLLSVSEVTAYHAYMSSPFLSTELKVTITANYTPAPGEDPDDLDPDEFTAGSILILNCTVQGKSGTLSYEWSVTGNPDTPGCRKL